MKAVSEQAQIPLPLLVKTDIINQRTRTSEKNCSTVLVAQAVHWFSLICRWYKTVWSLEEQDDVKSD